MTSPRAWLPRALVATVPLVLLAGCGADETPVATPSSAAATPSPTATPTPSATDGIAAADQAQIRDLLTRYQAVYHQAYSKPDADPTLWAGIANDELTASNVASVKNYISQGITFEGQQVFDDVTIEPTSAGAAVVHVCLDESGWIGSTKDETLPPRPTDVYPITFAAAQTSDGTWLLGIGPKVATGQTC